MPRRRCCRHHGPGACTCEMGNLYRFAEPIVLIALARRGSAHGYQIAQDAEGLAVTHAGLDAPAIYRTLRRLEENGMVESSWDTEGGGPARHIYRLTETGTTHLSEWEKVLGELSTSLEALRAQCRELLSGESQSA